MARPLSLVFFVLLYFVAPSTSFATDRLTFDWDDVNTRNVVRWEGDTAVIQNGASIQSLSCRIRIQPRDIARAIHEFGIPVEWTLINYRSKDELEMKQFALQERASTHGIRMLEDNRFIVDYSWVIDHSVHELRSVARSIRSAAMQHNYTSRRKMVGAFASFVQSLEYSIPPDYRIDEEGDKVLTGGAMMPLDTLARGWGDCDSKCLLFASLIQSINLVKVCFIMLDDHLFMGVQLSPLEGEYSIRHRGKDWVLVELCDAWPMGRIPEEHYSSVINGQYEIVDLD